MHSANTTHDHYCSSSSSSSCQEQQQQDQEAAVSCKRRKPAKNKKSHLFKRRRRERVINAKIRMLRDLIPNCDAATANKVGSALDETIEYLKILQLHLQIVRLRSRPVILFAGRPFISIILPRHPQPLLMYTHTPPPPPPPLPYGYIMFLPVFVSQVQPPLPT